jgi:hypothetical protein
MEFQISMRFINVWEWMIHIVFDLDINNGDSSAGLEKFSGSTNEINFNFEINGSDSF